MKHRKLRIAWSVAWGIVAVLLIALWVRSYSCIDIAAGVIGHDVASIRGTIAVDDTVLYQSSKGDRVAYFGGGGHDRFFIQSYQQFFLNWRRQGTGVGVPYCALVIPTSVIVVAPWIRFRFSLRTLLIATTLVALGLGLIVWLR